MTAQFPVLLTSSLEADNREAVCPNERVELTCHVAFRGILQWAVESFVTIGSSEIVCTALTSPGESCSNTVFLYFNATLTSFQPIAGPGEQGNITSSLTIIANSYTTGKLIYCSNGRLSQNESPNTLFHIGGNYRLILFRKLNYIIIMITVSFQFHPCHLPPLPTPLRAMALLSTQ